MNLIENYQQVVWIVVGVIPVFIVASAAMGMRVARQHKNMVSYYSRYISTRQATNDILEVIIFNLTKVRDMIMRARTIVTAEKIEGSQDRQKFEHATNDFDSYISQLPSDNSLSVNRSYTTENLQKLAIVNPIRSIMFLLPSVLALGLLGLLANRPSDLPISLWVLIAIVVAEIVLLYFSIRRNNQRSTLRLNIEKKLITTLELFDIRRIFISDTLTKLNHHLGILNSFEEYCRDVHQANDYSKAIDVLSLNIRKLEDVYAVTNINVDTPLLSVSPVLQKTTANQYMPAAQSRSVRFVNNLQPGLSFHMTQANISKLIDHLVLDAINNSAPGQTVTLNGRPLPHLVEIELLESTHRINEAQLPLQFKFDPKTAAASEDFLDLSLRLARLIVSTEAGEIKLSITKNGELSIKMSIPKSRSHELIKVNPTISKSSSPIN